MALCADGTVVQWGWLLGSQLGGEISRVPVSMQSRGALVGKKVVKLRAGFNNWLALCSDGTLVCWGANNAGQLGNGTTGNEYLGDRYAPVAVTMTGVLAGKTIKDIAVGYATCLVLCLDGTLVSWGSNSAGQLGIGTKTNSNVPVRVTQTGVLAGKTVVEVFAGSTQCYALCSDGSMAAWGDNSGGGLGNGTTTESTLPVLVSRTNFATGEVLMTNVGSVSASAHALALSALPPVPVATTLAADGVTDNTATLRASVRPNGSATPVFFEYGRTSDYGFTVAATPATVSGGGATAVAADLTNLQPGTTYHFRVVAASDSGIVRGADATFTTGHPLLFAGYALSTPFQTPATVALRKLVANASDPDGDTISVTSAGPASANGGTAVLLADSIRFTPPNGFSGADSFTVVLTDEGGASVTGTVTVNVGQAPNAGGIGSNPPKLTVLPGGKLAISFQGIPGRTYTVQRSVGGLDDWETLATITADAAGRVSFTDDNPPPGSAFYRLVIP